jgi:hypothetical protein
MEFRILGSLEVDDDGRRVTVRRGKEQALLAYLLLHANEFVPTDRLIDELWGERPTPTARKTLQNAVSQLRRAVGDDRILTEPSGYRSKNECTREADPSGLQPARDRPGRRGDLGRRWEGPASVSVLNGVIEQLKPGLKRGSACIPSGGQRRTSSTSRTGRSRACSALPSAWVRPRLRWRI